MRKYKLAVLSFSILILGLLIGYWIAVYNQQRHIIQNNKASSETGYIYTYKNPEKKNLSEITELGNIYIDSNKINSNYQYMQYIYGTLVDIKSTESLIQLIEEIEKDTNTEQQYRAILAVIDKLVLIDPIKAMNHVLSMKSDRKEDLVQGLFRAWSKHDLEQAVVKAITFSDSLREVASRSILEECAQIESCSYSDVYENLNQDQSLPITFNGNLAKYGAKRMEDHWYHTISENDNLVSIRLQLQDLATRWVSQAGLIALNKINKSLANPQLKYDILSIALVSHSMNNPKESFEFALELPISPVIDNVFPSIFSSWVENDPVEAFEIVSNVNEMGRKRNFQDSVLSFWSYKQPETLLEYSDFIPKELRFMAKKLALMQIADKKPREAIEMANQVLGVEHIEQGLNQLLQRWSTNDVTSALNWLLVHEEHANNVELLKTVLREYARYYPAEAMQLTENMEMTNKLAVQQMVVLSISESDALYARDLLSKMDPASQMINFHAVTRGLVKQGYALEAIALLDNSLINKLQDNTSINELQDNSSVNPIQEQFTYTVINEWLMIDPIDAYTNLSRITNEKFASRLAQRLIANNRYDQNFEPRVIAEIQAYVLPEHETEIDKSEFHRNPPPGEIMIMLRPQ